MSVKSILVAALLIAAPALAQEAPQPSGNFILGHGFVQPVAPTSDYPPGHGLTNVASMPAPAPAAPSRNGTDGTSRTPSVQPAQR